MTSSRTLPNPTWHGSPSNLLPLYIAHLNKHARTCQVDAYGNSVHELRKEIRRYESYVKDYDNYIEGQERDLARIRAKIALLKLTREFSDEEYEAAASALLSHPSVIASRTDKTGSLVLLVRPRRKDELDLGDFQINKEMFTSSTASMLLCRASHWPSIAFREAYHDRVISSEPLLIRYRMTLNHERVIRNLKKLEMVDLLDYVVRRINRLYANSYRDFPRLDEETAKPLWEGHTTSPGTALKQLVRTALNNAVTSQLHTLENDRDYILNTIGRYRRAQSTQHNELRQYRTRLAKLERVIAETTVEIDEEAARADLEFITTGIPGFMGMRFDADGTPVVHIRSSYLYRGRRYDLGDFEFWLKQNTGNNSSYGVMPVAMTRIPANGVRSPYLSTYADQPEDNWFCFGGRCSSMSRILDKGEFGHLLNVAVHSINRMNKGDERIARRLTQIPIDEVWRNRPRRRPRRRSRTTSQMV